VGLGFAVDYEDGCGVDVAAEDVDVVEPAGSVPFGVEDQGT